MSDLGEEVKRKIQELNANLKRLHSNGSTQFSSDSLDEFLRGFDIPVIGTLEYIKANITTHKNKQCMAIVNDADSWSITDKRTYEEFSGQTANLTLPLVIDFKFHLSSSNYNTPDVTVHFSVVFDRRNYTVKFEFADSQLLEFRKDYMKHIEPSEIKSLQDHICNTILNKVSAQIERLE